MSDYTITDRKCPKCDGVTIGAIDNAPRHYQYTYVCEDCGFKTMNLEKFKKLEKDTEDE